MNVIIENTIPIVMPSALQNLDLKLDLNPAPAPVLRVILNLVNALISVIKEHENKNKKYGA